MAAHPNAIKEPTFDRVYFAITKILLIALLIIILYPLWFVLMASMSDAQYVNNGTLLFYPRGFTGLGYQRTILNEKVWIGYGNTILYTVGGTLIGTFCTVLAGYSLSRSDLPGGSVIMKLYVFTMYFGGGMVPFYIVVRNLGLLDTRFLMIIVSCISVYNIILVRSYFVTSLPKELYEAASIDGCGNGRFLFQIVIPLSKAIIAVIALYVAVSYWNSYFYALIFLTDYHKYPLQIFLREILLTANQNTADTATDPSAAQMLAQMSSVIKYSVIVVSTVPIICVYPFIQKYFVQGVMIGSVKG
ncbi:MAG: carbohydrate ABC transporter permease [Provencibacterium sp.]|jgi:putative aldouronate transport system permease protein|nr:carbohydrate ABC transporter permease [Provencibacterium sp.]